MRDEILTKLTSCECWQHAFDFEIVVNVDACLSLVERLAHTAKATGNRDNLMGLYLSEEVEEEEETGGRRGGARGRRPERPRAVKEKFRGPIYRTRLSPREKEIGIETKITDLTFPSSPLFVLSAPRPNTHICTHTNSLFPKQYKSNWKIHSALDK